MTMVLSDLYKRFPTPKSCTDFIERIAWNGTPVCPYCKSHNFTPSIEEERYHCNTCNTSFSVTVKTLFHKTKVDLQKWFYLLFLITYEKKLPSLRYLGEEMGVTKDTVSKMIKRIRNQDVTDKIIIDKILNEIYHEKKHS